MGGASRLKQCVCGSKKKSGAAWGGERAPSCQTLVNAKRSLSRLQSQARQQNIEAVLSWDRSRGKINAKSSKMCPTHSPTHNP